MPDPSKAAPADRIPRFVWLVALSVAALRSLPFLRALLIDMGTDALRLPIGYVPKDWLQYAALLRHSDQGPLFLINPFTTEPQGGHFILLYHQLLGSLHQLTGVDVFWLLELSRWPATLLLFAILWRFLQPILPDLRHRRFAIVLVAFGGGFNSLVWLLARAFPAIAEYSRDLWHLYGWSTFESCYNPLWILGLTGILWINSTLLAPEGPVGRRAIAKVSIGFFLLWYLHAYSAMVLPVLAGGALVADWIGTRHFPGRRLLRIFVALLPGVLLAGLTTLWQLGDPVFRASSGYVWGSQRLAIFWYPVALGGVGLLAVLGWRDRRGVEARWLRTLAGWAVAAMWLSASPLLNGYHFIFVMHLPLAIVGAPVLADFVSRRWVRGAAGRRWALLALCAIFVSPVTATWASVAEVADANEGTVERGAMAIVTDLAKRPRGHVLAPPVLGNLIPALTHHRVWVGHWFLTPAFGDRVRRYRSFQAQPEGGWPGIATLVRRHRLRYLVLPSRSIPAVRRQLAVPPCGSRSFPLWTLLILPKPGAAPAEACRVAP